MADGLAIGVQTVQRLSLIPGWAGFAALEPELGVEHKGGPTGPPIFFLLSAWTPAPRNLIARLYYL